MFVLTGDILLNAELYEFRLMGVEGDFKVVAFGVAGDQSVVFKGTQDECRVFIVELATLLNAKTWNGSRFLAV